MGQSEIILGKALKSIDAPRESSIIITKVFYCTVEDSTITFGDIVAGVNPDDLGYVNRHGLSRKHIFDAIKASLRRLNLNYIDVLQCHRFDSNVEIPETMHALHDVVQAGYARYIGMSSCGACQFHAMHG
jgi:aryl-alcohol dehydrogenase-like predicted oxidoreductase